MQEELTVQVAHRTAEQERWVDVGVFGDEIGGGGSEMCDDKVDGHTPSCCWCPDDDDGGLVRVLRGSREGGWWLEVMTEAEYARTGGRMIIGGG